MGGSNTPWRGLAERSPVLFLVAGALLVGYGALNGVEAFTDVEVTANVFEVGYVVGFLGLLGLYPRLGNESPWLARAGAVAATAGLLGATLVTLRSVGHLAGAVPEYPVGWGIVVVLMVTGFVVGFLSFGVAAIRVDGHPRAVGLALLAPGVIVVLMLLHMAAGLERPESVFVISSGQAMAHLAIGSVLQQSSRSERDEPSDGAEPRMASHD